MMPTKLLTYIYKPIRSSLYTKSQIIKYVNLKAGTRGAKTNNNNKNTT